MPSPLKLKDSKKDPKLKFKTSSLITDGSKCLKICKIAPKDPYDPERIPFKKWMYKHNIVLMSRFFLNGYLKGRQQPESARHARPTTAA